MAPQSLYPLGQPRAGVGRPALLSSPIAVAALATPLKPRSNTIGSDTAARLRREQIPTSPAIPAAGPKKTGERMSENKRPRRCGQRRWLACGIAFLGGMLLQLL